MNRLAKIVQSATPSQRIQFRKNKYGKNGAREFLRDLMARGLSGVRLVVSDDHKGLKQAVAAVLTGASWQRCRTHFARNVLTRVPKSAQPLVATLVRSIFAQPSAGEVWAASSALIFPASRVASSGAMRSTPARSPAAISS